jgi:hypothetical protein
MSNNGDDTIASKYVVGRTTTGTEVGYCVLFGNTIIPFKEAELKNAFLALPGNTDTTYAMFVKNDGISTLPATLDERNTK